MFFPQLQAFAAIHKHGIIFITYPGKNKRAGKNLIESNQFLNSKNTKL
jgi:hypothetical protein